MVSPPVLLAAGVLFVMNLLFSRRQGILSTLAQLQSAHLYPVRLAVAQLVRAAVYFP